MLDEYVSLDKTQAICYNVTKCNANRRIKHMPRSHESQEKIPAWKKLLASALATAALTGCAPGVSASNSPENTSSAPAATAPETIAPTSEVKPPVEPVTDSDKYWFTPDKDINYGNHPYEALTVENVPRRYVDPVTNKESRLGQSDFYDSLLITPEMKSDGEVDYEKALMQLMKSYNTNVLNAATTDEMYLITNAKADAIPGRISGSDPNQPLVIRDKDELQGSAAGYAAYIKTAAEGALTDRTIDKPDSIKNLFEVLPEKVAENNDALRKNGSKKGYQLTVGASDVKYLGSALNYPNSVVLSGNFVWRTEYDTQSAAGKKFAKNVEKQGGPAIDQGSMQVNYVLRNMRLDDGRWYVALVAIPDLDTDKFILYKG